MNANHDARGQGKQSNPKDAIGSKKLPMHLVPTTAIEYMALAFLEGACKYGKYNWRIAGVRTSVYVDAIDRHMAKFLNGQWRDPKTKVPHFASIMACCAIVLDAELCGQLTDDRPPMLLGHSIHVDGLAETCAHIRKVFQKHKPHQFTIADHPDPTNAVEVAPARKTRRRSR